MYVFTVCSSATIIKCIGCIAGIVKLDSCPASYKKKGRMHAVIILLPLKSVDNVQSWSGEIIQSHLMLIHLELKDYCLPVLIQYRPSKNSSLIIIESF